MSRLGLKILTLNKENEPHGYVKLVIYKEVLLEVLNNHGYVLMTAIVLKNIKLTKFIFIVLSYKII